jgi:hypothetical protein
MRQPRLGAVNIYEILWRRWGHDLGHLWLFTMRLQNIGVRDSVSITPMAFDQQLNVLTCPRERFCKDLLCQMKQWWAAGKCLVL